MDYLREGIHLRGFAQIDPLVAYKNEGFSMFRELMNAIWEEYARTIFHLEVKVDAPDGAQTVFGPAEQQARDVSYSGGDPLAQPSALYDTARGSEGGNGAPATSRARETVGAGAIAGVGAGPAAPSPITADPTTGTVHKDEREKIGRNDPCWCGSGKKYKKCHGA
jgi:preprotein translocase subunit SecA